MKEKIKEVQDYFKSKLLAKDFEIEIIDSFAAYITIDGIYHFTIWIGNPQVPKSTNQHYGKSFIDMGLSDEDCCKLHELISADVATYLKKIKEKQLEQLKKELENL